MNKLEKSYTPQSIIMTKIKTKLPTCKLIGINGNVFSSISVVHNTLIDAHLHKQAKMFRTAILNAHNYDEVLQLCFKYVDVQ